MGFAIPSQIVRPTVETLIRDGKVSHGHIGIGIADVTPENAKFFDESNATGGVVTQVEPDSPGAKAGLQIGDVITEIDGQKVSDAGELQVLVGQKQPGSKIMLKVLRDGKSMTIPVTLEELGSRNAEGKDELWQRRRQNALGHRPRQPYAGAARSDSGSATSIHGAVIEQVQPGSSADNAGLQQGDIILEVNRHKVQIGERCASTPCRKLPRGRMHCCWFGRTAATPSGCCTLLKAPKDPTSNSIAPHSLSTGEGVRRCFFGQQGTRESLGAIAHPIAKYY